LLTAVGVHPFFCFSELSIEQLITLHVAPCFFCNLPLLLGELEQGGAPSRCGSDERKPSRDVTPCRGKVPPRVEKDCGDHETSSRAANG
jgi:hypothetical protein